MSSSINELVPREIDKNKKKEVDEIIKKFDGDTESLAKEISIKLGVTYVSRDEN